MPQYDAYEDPMPITPPPNPVVDPVVDPSPSRLPLGKAPMNKPLTTCYGEGINEPCATDTPEMDQNSPPPSSHPFHRRHSHLSRQESATDNPIESFNFPEPNTSPGALSQVERDQLAEFERSQQQDDEIRMILASEQQRTKNNKHKGQERVEMDAETEFNQEKHMLKGGWMHRSRASCELLRDHKSRNVGGD